MYQSNESSFSKGWVQILALESKETYRNLHCLAAAGAVRQEQRQARDECVEAIYGRQRSRYLIVAISMWRPSVVLQGAARPADEDDLI